MRFVDVLKRGDILAILPGGRITVLECIVTNLAAASCTQSASEDARSAAALTETHTHQAFERFGEGCKFVPLAVDFFSQLGEEVACFLSKRLQMVVRPRPLL